MAKLKTISLCEWFEVSTGVFLMGLGLGLTLTNFSSGPIFFFLGLILEIPALLAIKRHQPGKKDI